MWNVLGTVVNWIGGPSLARISSLPSTCTVEQDLKVGVLVMGKTGTPIEPLPCSQTCPVTLLMKSVHGRRQITYECDEHLNGRHIFRFVIGSPGIYAAEIKFRSGYDSTDLRIISGNQRLQVKDIETFESVLNLPAQQKSGRRRGGLRGSWRPVSRLQTQKPQAEAKKESTSTLSTLCPKNPVCTVKLSDNAESISKSSGKSIIHERNTAYVGKKYMLQLCEIIGSSGEIWPTVNRLSPVSLNMQFKFKSLDTPMAMLSHPEKKSSNWHIGVEFPQIGSYKLEITGDSKFGDISHNMDLIVVKFPEMSNSFSSMSLTGMGPSNEFEVCKPIHMQIQCKNVFDEKFERKNLTKLEPLVLIERIDGTQLAEELYTSSWKSNVWMSQFDGELIISEPGAHKLKIQVKQFDTYPNLIFPHREIHIKEGKHHKATKEDSEPKADMQNVENVEDYSLEEDLEAENPFLQMLSANRHESSVSEIPDFDKSKVRRSQDSFNTTCIIECHSIGNWYPNPIYIKGTDLDNLYNIERITEIDISTFSVSQGSPLLIEFEGTPRQLVLVQELVTLLLEGKYYRQVASAYENERVYFKEASQVEYGKKNHQMAKQCKSMKEGYALLMTKAHDRAMMAYLNFHNMNRPLSEIDLHDLRAYSDRSSRTPGEALDQVKERMKDEELYEKHRWLEIIVGAGHHSANKNQQIRATVERFLESPSSHEFEIYKDAGFEYEVINRGNILITFDGYTGKQPCQGQFYCQRCNRMWKSSRCWADYRQLCNRCNMFMAPHKLNPAKPGPPKRGVPTYGGPRHEELCEKCISLGHSCRIGK